MQRKYLEDLGLTKEVIDQIMNENGRDIEKQKKDTEHLNNKVSSLEKEIGDNQKALQEASIQIEQFKGMDIESIRRNADEWKQKYEDYQEESKKQKKEYEQQMQAKEYDFVAREYVNGYKFTSEFAKQAFLSDFKAKGLKLEEGKFLGADDYVKKFTENNQGVFVTEKTKENSSNAEESKVYTYKPQGSNAEPDLSSVIAGAISGSI